MFNAIVRFYNWANYETQDPRSKDLPMMLRPLSLLGILIFYNYFVLSLGPQLMKNRKPFNLKKVMIAYNLMQIIINAYIFSQAFLVGWSGHYSYMCNDLDFTDNPFERKVTNLVYVYFLIKMFDLIDTVFFVMRKKQSHVSFLHLYHHTGMAILSYATVKYLGGGHHTFVGLINTFVHMFMYLYYLTSILFPSKAVFWWKKFITQLQMFQFAAIFTFLGQTILYSNCNYPKWILFVVLPQNGFLLFLFYDFYKKSYHGKKGKAAKNEKHNEQKTGAKVTDGKHIAQENGANVTNGKHIAHQNEAKTTSEKRTAHQKETKVD